MHVYSRWKQFPVPPLNLTELKSNINHISNINTLKLIWNAFILLWIMEQFLGGNSSNSAQIFTLQEKIIRIMAGAQPRISCI
jgi:hypothetical protein